MMMDDDQLLSIVEAEFEQAMGAPGGEISEERAKAFDYYLSKPFGNEIEGQSQVVTSDVSDVVDGTMPSLLRMFTTQDNLVSFDAVEPGDEPLAQQESDYINHIFFKQNPSFEILFFWFFDALVQKNGIVKCWLDESECVTTETYTGLTLEDANELLEDPELEPVERSDRQEDGETLYDITFNRITKERRYKVENVPPDEYRISADCRSLDPAQARMVGQERDVPRSDLIDMGFDKDVVDSLPANSEHNSQDNSEKISKYDKTDERRDASHDRSRDLVSVRECYIKVDYDGDGRSELRQIITAGNTVLSNEPVDRQPFHVLTPQPLPHKHFGMAQAEKVMDIQQKHSTLERQMLDNLYHVNNPGHGVWDEGMNEDTLDDLLTRRAGSVTTFSRPVNESYAPMTTPFTAAAVFPVMEYYDKVKRDRTGVNSDGEGLNPEQLKNIQTSVFAQANDVHRMKIEMIARVFAETGLRSLFMHLHELVRKHQKKVEIVQLRNTWVPVQPSSWRDRKNVTINIGLGIGTKEQNLLHLNNFWEKQMQLLDKGFGNLLVTPQNLFQTLGDMAKNADRRVPEMYFTNPGQQMAPPPNQEQMQLQQQQQQIQQQQQQMMAAQQQLEIEKLRIQQEKEALRHQRDQGKLSLEAQKHNDEMMAQAQEREQKLIIEMEKLANQLTEMDMKYAGDVEDYDFMYDPQQGLIRAG